jgi:hypothetical protein
VKGHQSVFKGDGSIEMAKQLSKEKVIDLLARLEVSALCAVCRVSNCIFCHYFEVNMFSLTSPMCEGLF